jgi:hypothetical protein
MHWRVMIECPATELVSATTAMIRWSLEDKVEDLIRWKGEFEQRWLLLLNCYPLAENTTELQDTLRRLGREIAGTHRLDGIFWSGFPNRTLTRIPLAKKLGESGSELI